MTSTTEPAHESEDPAAPPERSTVSAGAPARHQPVASTKLGFFLRCRMRTRHTLALSREVRRHGVEQRLWWLLPLFVVIVLLAAAISTTTTALPVAVYTLF